MRRNCFSTNTNHYNFLKGDNLMLIIEQSSYSFIYLKLIYLYIKYNVTDSELKKINNKKIVVHVLCFYIKKNVFCIHVKFF